MDQLNYYFSDHWGGSALNTDFLLYEITWNNYGYHGMFELQCRKKLRYNFNKTLHLSICRIDGTMKKRHELKTIYSSSDKCFTKLNDCVYLSFPSKDLCLLLLLNFTKEQRIEIANSLCFNFGEGYEFDQFKSTKQYKVSILRNTTEEKFLSILQECKQIIFCDFDVNLLINRNDITINKTI